MPHFTIHSLKSAPVGSKNTLRKEVKKHGAVINLFGILAESPQTLQAYLHLYNLLSESSLNNEEKTVIWQVLNIEHDCTYCVPAHTALANVMGVHHSLTAALRNQHPLPTKQLEALKDFTLEMVRTRGRVDDVQIERFLNAGFTQQNVLEIILALSHKVISNYTNHVAYTPLDPMFVHHKWP
ncbi:carboxymuconolactone decarboxylase family protein [Vibrio maerlii]|uniref:carboxymuconolactone decarboxylase family protein n=1 Tax=Vibrio maerlii TaxID=2231648 RepID=UPI000E3DB6AE|nr:carboxymuconolactone decarboxylase family protein [Vibrio maerlii]